jgi:hypothetical protein
LSTSTLPHAVPTEDRIPGAQRYGDRAKLQPESCAATGAASKAVMLTEKSLARGVSGFGSKTI